MSDFVHLHVHSEFSLLDGLSKISALINKTKEYGQDAIALTDHGVMYGAIEFYKKATAAEVKPIIGCEIYVAEGSRLDKSKRSANHLVLLAKDIQGYQNLLCITSIGQTEGFYYKPRVDKEILLKYHKGLIATSACAASQVQQHLIHDDYQAAKKETKELEQIFGANNFYLELQRHHFDEYAKQPQVPSSVKQKILESHQQLIKGEKGLIKLSQELGIPLVATNDVHYVEKDDARAQDALVCIQTGKLISDTNRMRYIDTPDFYLKSPQEMKKEFSDLPEAISNTKKIANRCNVEIKLGEWYFPPVDLPKNKTAGEALRDKTLQGAKEKFAKITPEIKKRINYELDIIEKKGYSSYFLLFSQIIDYCDKAGISTNTRGSAAGCFVSYSCGITTVDPLRFHLPFERFLNPFRPSPPDIDLDISDDRREEVFQYLKEHYGSDRVAQICTFGTMKARMAVRDIGRVLGVAYSDVDRIAKLIPMGSQGFPMTIDRALETTPDLKEIYKKEKEVKELLDLSRKIEGNTRHISVHACALVISPNELVKFSPLQKEPGGGDRIITQYEHHACEDVGLIKLDILGIRNLSIMSNAIKIVKKLKDIDIDIKNVPLDDEKTFKILTQGETFGIFQLASSGMTRYLVELKPERIEDIMAMVALYRPGPMSFIPEYIKRKHNPEIIKYFDPRMKEYLAASYGILTYQDDVLYTAINLAGYNWGEVDKLRKAIGKKIPEEMEKQHSKFVEGCVDHGMKRKKAEELFEMIETFAAYGFNKSHAASYGMVAYWTAYIKAHYPVEFMTALMSAEANNTDKLIEAINECERLGIRVLPPDINESLINFTIVDVSKDQWLKKGRVKNEGKAIRFGLNAIKNVGEAALETILEVRNNNPFVSFSDFIHRVNLQKVNKRVVESLIGTGAMDRFGNRASLIAYLPQVRDAAIKSQKDKASGQVSLFGASESVDKVDKLPEIEEMPLIDLLKKEKALLGIYITDHPAKNISRFVQGRSCRKINSITDDTVNHKVTIAGIIGNVRLVNTKRNNSRMAFAGLEDDTGNLDLVIFPKLYSETKDIWESDKTVVVEGRVDNRDDVFSVLVDTVEIISMDKEYKPPTEIVLSHGTSKEKMQQINTLLKSVPGSDHICIILRNGGEDRHIPLPYTVKVTPGLKRKIKEIIKNNLSIAS